MSNNKNENTYELRSGAQKPTPRNIKPSTSRKDAGKPVLNADGPLVPQFQPVLVEPNNRKQPFNAPVLSEIGPQVYSRDTDNTKKTGEQCSSPSLSKYALQTQQGAYSKIITKPLSYLQSLTDNIPVVTNNKNNKNIFENLTYRTYTNTNADYPILPTNSIDKIKYTEIPKQPMKRANRINPLAQPENIITKKNVRTSFSQLLLTTVDQYSNKDNVDKESSTNSSEDSDDDAYNEACDRLAEMRVAPNPRDTNNTTTRAPQPGAPIHYTNIAPGRVKIGEHSVELVGVSQDLSYRLNNPQMPQDLAANYFAQASKAINLLNQRIYWHNATNRYVVRSQLVSPPDYPHRVPTFFATSSVSTSLPRDTRFNLLNIGLTPVVPVGRLELFQMAALGAENLPSQRKFMNVIGPLMSLTVQQSNYMSMLSNMWDASLGVYDKSAIYAKVLTLAITRARYEREAIAPIYHPVNTNNIRYIRIVDPVGNAIPDWVDQMINYAFAPDTIVFDWAHDYRATSYLFYILLSMAGPHFNVSGGREIPSRAYNLPAINIVIIAKAEQPAAPRNIAFTSTEMFAFARTLANTRREYSDYERGMYMAMEVALCDLVRVRNAVAAVAARNGEDAIPAEPALYTPVTAYFDATPPQWPQPQDSNYLARFLGQYPNVEVAPTSEFVGLTTTTTDRLMLMIVLWTALIRSMATTVLYGVNITGRMLQHGLCNAFESTVFESFYSQSMLFQCGVDDRGALAEQNCNFHPIVSNLLNECTGMRTAPCYYTNRQYNTFERRGDIDLGNVDQLFTLLAPNCPPRIGTPLCIDTYTTLRPMEWGISTPGPLVNFRHDFLGSDRNRVGFYSFLSDNSFTNMAAVLGSFKLVPYAASFVNTARQIHGERDNALNIVFSTAQVSVGLNPTWTYNDDTYPYALPNLEGAVHPDVATVMTYDWLRGIVIAPAIVIEGQGDDAVQERMNMYIGNCAPRAGYVKTTYNQQNVIYADIYEDMLGTPMHHAAAQRFNHPGDVVIPRRIDPNVDAPIAAQPILPAQGAGNNAGAGVENAAQALPNANQGANFQNDA